jgi:hypothetical protein
MITEQIPLSSMICLFTNYFIINMILLLFNRSLDGKRENADSPLKTKKKRKMELYLSVPKLAPICSFQSTTQLCPEGNHCLFRYDSTSPSHQLLSSHRTSHPSYFVSISQKTVCKEWVEGRCTKGPHCDFLHQYIYHLLPQCNQDFQQGIIKNSQKS